MSSTEAMTEEGWLSRTLTNDLEACLGDRQTPRKKLLFGCGCARQQWHLVQREANRRAVETSERYADGLATREELARAWHSLDWEAVVWCEWPIDKVSGSVGYNEPVEPGMTQLSREADPIRRTQAARERTWCQVLREIHPNPFRPLALDRNWLVWHDRTVERLARAIYDQRAFEQLPILADALEDAGCTSGDLLAHLRGTEPHYLGCWALDLLLGQR